ncbi:MAG: alpha/beta hydrolase [Alphaproteobacteria bacterium]|nr:alpha/beta hydrolase [Alphaproteobacteria bacterium]
MSRLPPARVLHNGRGNCTVLIHGLLASPSFWTGTLPRSVQTGRAIAYPLPGHFPWRCSQSELDRLLDPMRLADAYSAAIQRDFNGRAVDLVGHSSGGYVSLLIAARHPDKVNSIAIVSGFADGSAANMQPMVERGIGSPSVGPLMFRSLLNLWTANPTTFRSGMSNLISNWQRTKRCPRFDDICERVRLDLRASDPNALLRAVRWLRRARGWHQLPRIKQSVCVVAGLRDQIIPISHQYRMAARLSGARVVPFRESGHLPMCEDHNAFSNVIDHWSH